MMLKVRSDLISVFKKMKRREKILKELNYLMISGVQTSEDEQKSYQELLAKHKLRVEDKVNELKSASTSVLSLINAVLTDR
jgi:hypothetical protein